jgi:agmatinase
MDVNAPASLDSGLFGLHDSFEDSQVVVIPVPYAATVSYREGAAHGPRAVFQASKQVDLYDIDVGRPYTAGIHMIDLQSVEDILNTDHKARIVAARHIQALISGQFVQQDNIDAVNASGDYVNTRVYMLAQNILSQAKIPVLLGGDHSTPYGLIKAVAEKYSTPIGILHIDAHADLRNAYEGFTWSHASIMFNVLRDTHASLVQIGIRDTCDEEAEFVRNSTSRIVQYTDKSRRIAVQKNTWPELCRDIISHLPQDVYISMDIDGLDPALCPNTGTPVPGGLSFDQWLCLMDTLIESGRRIVAADLNEVAAIPDNEDLWDAIVGARILYKLIGYCLLSQKAPIVD